MNDDTIAAISTPPGEGGISIIRVSGSQALSIADEIFHGETEPSQSPSHRILYGHIKTRETGEIIDEVLLMVMKSPKTYTAEDMIEINCHGGYFVTQSVLTEVLSCGSRLAEPGEFTKRAFLNGRIDLTQAEAVLDVIRARTAASLRLSLDHLGGRLLNEMESVKEGLVSVLAQLEMAIDFSDNEIQIMNSDQLKLTCERMLHRIGRLIETSNSGRFIRDGIKLTIVGKPNVGKSSLMNALLEEDRAIVSPAPGTTRDTIEEWLNIGGLSVQIVDTAGFGALDDEIGEEGERRATDRMERADLVLLVADGSCHLEEKDISIIRRLKSKKFITVVNKIDLEQKIDETHLRGEIRGPLVKISALKKLGLDELEKFIVDSIMDGSSIPPDSVIITHVRHLRALQKTSDSLQRAIESLNKGLSEEFIAADIREALVHLGEITGDTTTEEVLDTIFSEFCIGK